MMRSTTGSKRVWNIVLFFCAVVSANAALLAFFLTEYNELRVIFLNSDNLFPAALYDHLANGFPLTAWAWSVTPFWFPDTALYFLLRFLTGSVQVTAVWYAVTALVAYALCVLALERQMIARSTLAHDALVLTSVALLPGAFGLWLGQTSGIMGVELHGSIILGMCLSLAMSLRFLFGSITTRTSVAVLGGLGALGLLLTASDFLFVVQVSVPLAVALIPLTFWMPEHRRRAAALIATLGLCSLIGWGFDRVARSHADNLMILFAPARARDSLIVLVNAVASSAAQKPVHAILAAALLSSAGYVAAREAGMLRNRNVSAHPARFVFSSFVSCQAIIVLAFVVVTGIMWNSENLRYFLPQLTLSTGAGFVLLAVPPGELSQRGWRVLACLVLGASLVLAARVALNPPAFPQLAQIAAYYPANVACLDQRLQAQGVRYGVATYWQARATTYLSNSGLVLAQVHEDLSPYYWLTSIASFGPTPQFILLDRNFTTDAGYVIDETFVRDQFGDPAAIVDCPGARALIYNRESDTLVRHLFDGHPALAQFQRPGDEYRFLPIHLKRGVGKITGTALAVSGGPAAALLISQPIPLPAGKFQMEIEYSAEGNPGKVNSWQIAMQTGERENAGWLANGVLPNGTMSVRSEFRLTSAANVMLEVDYGGEGDLRVVAWRLRRLE